MLTQQSQLWFLHPFVVAEVPQSSMVRQPVLFFGLH